MEEMRLQKYLALAGVASRRKSEELITVGKVEVNGVLVTELGFKVNIGDKVLVEGREVRPEQKSVYILLHKPVGYVTTARDQFSRKTVLDLVEGVEERIYPVGRLDYDTSGLLLLTNDGDLAFKLTHPRHEMEKTYHARIRGHIGEAETELFRMGFRVEDYTTAPARIRTLEKTAEDSLVEIIIREGKNRQVRKMCETVGHPVLRLKRVAMGPIKLGELKEGAWRHLTQKEIAALMAAGK